MSKEMSQSAGMTKMPLVPVCPSITSPGLIQVIYQFSLRQLLVGRSAKLLMLLGLFPVVASILWRVYLGDKASLALQIVSSGFYTHMFLFVFTLAFGCSVIRDEIETSTMAYLFTRPVSRISIYLGKLFAAMTAVIVYSSVFVLLGAALTRPFLVGVLYAFVWEVFVPFMPGLVKKVSVMHFLFHMYPGIIKQQLGDIPPQVIGFLGSNPPSKPECFAGLAVFLVVSTALGFLVFSNKEYRLK